MRKEDWHAVELELITHFGFLDFACDPSVFPGQMFKTIGHHIFINELDGPEVICFRKLAKIFHRTGIRLNAEYLSILLNYVVNLKKEI